MGQSDNILISMAFNNAAIILCFLYTVRVNVKATQAAEINTNNALRLAKFIENIEAVIEGLKIRNKNLELQNDRLAEIIANSEHLREVVDGEKKSVDLPHFAKSA